MKKTWFSVFLLFFSLVGFTQNQLYFSIENSVFSSETDRLFSTLLMHVGKDLPETISVNFVMKNGKVLKKDFLIYEGCHLCTLPVSILPLNFENVTCSLLIKADGEEVASLPWGKCQHVRGNIDSRLIPDLNFDLQATLNRNGEVHVENSGASISKATIEAFAIVFNQKNEVIWSSQSQQSTDFPHYSSLQLKFPKQIEPWQWHLGCKAIVVLDPETKIHEASLMNNIKEAAFGECENEPSTQNGDYAEFEPEVTLLEGKILFSILNNDKLTYLGADRSLRVYVDYFNSASELIFQQEMAVKKDLHGFGTKTFVDELYAIPDLCIIQISLNPEMIVKESNYLNNTLKINLCL